MTITWLRRGAAAPQELPVERGRLACPKRGDADVEWCWTCRDLVGLGRGLEETVICRADEHHDVRLLAAILASPE